MDIRKRFYEIYWKIQGIIVPELRYSQCLYEDILNSHVKPDMIWLDLGCGHKILPTWRQQEEKNLVKKCKTVVGIDYSFDSLKKHKNIPLKARGDITKLPFKDNSFDLVSANMVVEHLENPGLQFLEINRIVKPKGVFIFHTPNLFGYTTLISKMVPEIFKDKLIYIFQGRKEEDVFDTYYRANSKKIIIRIANKTGFEIEKIKPIVSDAQLLIIPPLVVFELLWIRMLMTMTLKPLRTNIIAILRKRQQ